MFSAATAREAGLVTAVLEPAELAAHVRARAAALAAKAPQALVRTKALLRRLPGDPVMTRIAEEQEVFAACVAGPEFAEALAAFQAKRPADFSKL
jgi:enoyl-CoA hydratase/carnithine racemase